MKNLEVYFSQHGEDYLLWRFFKGKGNGFFVEVGALDGIRFSNTFFFEQQGWQGICVEPHPDFFQQLIKNRPNSICVQAAAGKEEDDLPFFAEPKGEFSTLVSENTQIENLKNKMSGYREILVKVLPLDKILSDNSAQSLIDFISIDVEGAEPDVLVGLSLKQYSPRCLVIEANGDLMNKTIDAIMKTHGYHKAGRLSKTNNFYCRKLIDSIKLSIIPIRCNTYNNQFSNHKQEYFEINEHCLLVQSLNRLIKRFLRKIKPKP